LPPIDPPWRSPRFSLRLPESSDKEVEKEIIPPFWHPPA
jgi:hypothetical protein